MDTRSTRLLSLMAGLLLPLLGVAQAPDRGADYGRGSAEARRFGGSESAGEGRREGRRFEDRVAGWEGGVDAQRGRGDREVEPAPRSEGYRHDNDRYDARDGYIDRRGHGYRDYDRERYAQPSRHRYDDRPKHRDRNEPWRHNWRHPQWRHHWHHGWSGHRYRAPVRYVYPRGYHSHSWRIGLHLPPVFFVDRWYVDWRSYRLAPPPWGCRWLRVDGDLYLVDERSGEILDALYGFFYH